MMMLLEKQILLHLVKVIILIEFYIFIKKFDNQIKSKRFKKLIDCIKDLEKKIGLDDLDIEFAINNKLEIYLLQVRPISTTNKWQNKRDKEINKSILSSEKSKQNF